MADEQGKGSGVGDEEITRALIETIAGLPADKKVRLLQLLGAWERDEKRVHPRKRLRLAQDREEGQAPRFLIRDLSAGGLFLRSEAPMTLGQEVSLTLLFAHQREPLRIQGQVVRITPQGVGIQFHERHETVLKDIL